MPTPSFYLLFVLKVGFYLGRDPTGDALRIENLKASFGIGKWISVSLRPLWSTQQFPGQTELYKIYVMRFCF